MTTPLITAIKQQSVNNLDKLISESDVGFVDNLGKTALMYSCMNGMTEVALKLINTGMSKPEQVDIYGSTALILTCYTNMTEVAIALINTGMSKPEQVNTNNNTALMLACYRGMSEVAIALINTGMSKPEHTDNDKETALIMACHSKLTPVALALINTGMSKPDNVNRSGSTALIIACDNKMSEVALALINTGMSKPEQSTNMYSETALIMACDSKMTDVALALINTGMSKPEHVNSDGNTALITACINGLSDVAISLINTGMSIPEHVNNKGNTALYYAKDYDMTEVISLLEQNLKKKADLNNNEYNKIDSNNINPKRFNINQDCLDLIMYEEVPITEYLENGEHIVVVFYDSNIHQSIKIGLDIENVENAMNTQENYIVYECINPDTMTPNNIVKNTPYFDIKKLCGFGDLVELKEMMYVLEFINAKHTKNNIFIFRKTDKQLKTTVSDDVLNNRTNYISARHCQKGQSADVYALDRNIVFSCQDEIKKEETNISDENVNSTTNKKSPLTGGKTKKKKTKKSYNMYRKSKRINKCKKTRRRKII